jgi:hypothetical protein
LAVFTVSTTVPKSHPDTAASSSSAHGINIPDGVLCIPEGSSLTFDDSRLRKFWNHPWVDAVLPLRQEKLGGCQSISASSFPSSAWKNLVDGFDGLRVC